MTREQLTQVLDNEKASAGSNDFAICVSADDLRSTLARLRHFKAKGTISDYSLAKDLSDCHIRVFGYTS